MCFVLCACFVCALCVCDDDDDLLLHDYYGSKRDVYGADDGVVVWMI